MSVAPVVAAVDRRSGVPAVSHRLQASSGLPGQGDSASVRRPVRRSALPQPAASRLAGALPSQAVAGRSLETHCRRDRSGHRRASGEEHADRHGSGRVPL